MSSERSPDDHREQARRNYERVKNEVVSEKKRSILSEYRADDFDSVLLIATAPRGGSSLLFDILRHHEETCSLDGEHDRWFMLNGVCYPALESDVVPADFGSFDRSVAPTSARRSVRTFSRSNELKSAGTTSDSSAG